MGFSGYGTGAVPVATTSTDSSGSWLARTILCPSGNPNAPTYVVATGGDVGLGSNSAIGLMSLMGPCHSITTSTFVVVNELTTAAAEWALAQFIGSDGQTIGTPPSNSWLFNAFFLVDFDLVKSYAYSGGTPDNTGVPADFLPTAAECTGSSPPVNCDALERINTLANVIVSCINSAGPTFAQCGILFSNTGNSTTTLQAAHVMVTNPTANVAPIFNITLFGSAYLFTPNFSSAPDGWELALNFAPSGAKFSKPNAVAIDAQGSAWVPNYDGNTVTELNALGRLIGNFAPDGANLVKPHAVAIDAASNVWVPNYFGNTVTELDASGGLVGNFVPGGANFDWPSGVAIDAAGNVWVPNFLGNTVTKLNSSGGLIGNFAPSGANFDGPSGVAIDAAGNAWVPNYSVYNFTSVTELNSGGGLVGSFAPSGANIYAPEGVAIDAAGNVWLANSYSSTVTELDSSGGLVGSFQPHVNGQIVIKSPGGVAIDAAGNVWVPDRTGNSVTELNSSGGLVGNFAPSGANFNGPSGVAIDSTGNVWVPNFDGNSVTELIGAAAPVRTPLVACLKGSPPKAVCPP